MLQGQYTFNVGANFRVAFPSAYRERLGQKIIITYGFEKSLIATSEKNWDGVYKKEIENKSFLVIGTRDLKRFFLGGVSNIEFDQQGRFVIPEYLRSYSEIQVQSQVTFVWQGEYIEIWSTRHWRKRQAEVLKNIASIAEKLSGQGDGHE